MVRGARIEVLGARGAKCQVPGAMCKRCRRSDTIVSANQCAQMQKPLMTIFVEASILDNSPFKPVRHIFVSLLSVYTEILCKQQC